MSINSNYGASVENALSRLKKLDYSKAEEFETEVKNLFTDGVSNGGQKGAAKIEKQIEELEARIGELQETAAKKAEEIANQEKIVKDKADSVAQKAAALSQAASKMQKKIGYAAMDAAYVAVASYRFNNGRLSYEECFNQAYRKTMTNVSGDQDAVRQAWANYMNSADGMGSCCQNVENAVNDLRGMQNEAKNLGATITLLENTKNIMQRSGIDDAIKNSNTDAKAPILTGEKLEFANSLMAKYKLTDTGMPSGGEQKYAVNTTEIEALKEKYASQNTEKRQKGQAYNNRATNPELENLNQAVAAGMLDDLQSVGMSADEIISFVQENWDVGIGKFDDGTWKIPKGHTEGEKGKDPAYSALYKLAKSGGEQTVYLTSDAVNQTQKSDLNKAITSDNVLKQMSDKGFTFKEAMFTLTKLFPDAGITYDLENQSKGENYGIVQDIPGENLYANIASQISKYWGVSANDTTKKIAGEKVAARKFDPIGFQVGNTSYTFLNDRDSSNTFDFTNGENNELLGSQNGIDELKAFDIDGNGTIEGDELKNLLVMKNDMSYDEDKSSKAANKKNGDVDFSIAYGSAYDMGIRSIDLASLTDKPDLAEDINGSSVQNSFNITMNNKSVAARETYDTENVLQALYGQVANNKDTSLINVKTSENDANKAFSAAERSELLTGIQAKAANGDRASENIKNIQEAVEEELKNGWSRDFINKLTSNEFVKGAVDSAMKASSDKKSEISDQRDEAVQWYSSVAANDASNAYFEDAYKTEEESKKEKAEKEKAEKEKLEAQKAEEENAEEEKLEAKNTEEEAVEEKSIEEENAEEENAGEAKIEEGIEEKSIEEAIEEKIEEEKEEDN